MHAKPRWVRKQAKCLENNSQEKNYRPGYSSNDVVLGRPAFFRWQHHTGSRLCSPEYITKTLLEANFGAVDYIRK